MALYGENTVNERIEFRFVAVTPFTMLLVVSEIAVIEYTCSPVAQKCSIGAVRKLATVALVDLPTTDFAQYQPGNEACTMDSTIAWMTSV